MINYFGSSLLRGATKTHGAAIPCGVARRDR